MKYLIELLPVFVAIPLIGYVISLFLPHSKEALLSKFSFSIAGVQLISILAFIAYWIFIGMPSLTISDFVIVQTHEYKFFIDFWFDKITAVFILLGAFLTFLVTLYSRFYLHREKGYKRFFNTVLLFFLGYNITVFAGNLETLFLGWEILGISSFLLIAFYRERYLPVKNAVKVFAIYRIGDIGLILAMWASHHFWHENIDFMKFTNSQLVDIQLNSHYLIGTFISLMIVIAATIKSAQMPFSSWLPRAMEGPTPSSAIFYGSLSVHIGAFLLLRTQAFWEHQLSIKILICLIGFVTSIIANAIARVQSSVKSQIAYSSISQIGIIFIEIALGLDTIALIHIAGNAFLRTYQLLVSPSVVSYLIREQFNNFVPRPLTYEDYIPKWMENTFFILSLKEWNLDTFIYKIYWKPLKWVGRRLNFITFKSLFYYYIPFALVSIFLDYHKETFPESVEHYFPYLYGLLSILFVLKSFAEKNNAIFAWTLLIMNHFWIAIALSFNENFDFGEVYLYLSGIVLSGGVGFWALFTLNKIKRKTIGIHDYQGYAYSNSKIATTFFIACLGLSGFPITPTFIGEDLIFSHIHSHQVVLAVMVSISFIVDGLAIIRIYSKIFLGPYVNAPQEMALKSS